MVSPNRAKLRAASYIETSYPFLLHSTAHAIPPIPAPTTITLNFGESRVIWGFLKAVLLDVSWVTTNISAGCGGGQVPTDLAAHPGRGVGTRFFQPRLLHVDCGAGCRSIFGRTGITLERPGSIVSFGSADFLRVFVWH
jgi:hypothetical protein